MIEGCSTDYSTTLSIEEICPDLEKIFITWPDGHKITADELPTVTCENSLLRPYPSAIGRIWKSDWGMILIVLKV